MGGAIPALILTLPIMFDNRQVYEQIPHLRNLDTSIDPIVTSSGSSTGACGRLCFQEPLCFYFRFLEGTCSLYETYPTPSGEAPGTVYYVTFGETPHKCPISSGFIYEENPRLCFKVYDFEVFGFNQSKGVCEWEGARPMVLSDDDKFDYVVQWIMNANPFSPYFWVGAQMKETGEYEWSDGSTNFRWYTEPNNPDDGCVGLIAYPGHIGLMGYVCDYSMCQPLCEITLF